MLFSLGRTKWTKFNKYQKKILNQEKNQFKKKLTYHLPPCKSSATKSDSLRKRHTILECNEWRFSHFGLLNSNICLQHYSKIQ